MPAFFTRPAIGAPVKPILWAKSIIFSYTARSIFNKLSISIFPQEILALIGPNGAGKTTLLRVLSGILPPHGGEVIVSMKDQCVSLVNLSARQVASHIAMIEQNIHSTFDFTVEQFVGMGRYIHDLRFSFSSVNEQTQVQSALLRTGLLSYAKRPLSSLSSGEKQRACIALALAQEPKILLLDEPLSHLDLRYQAEIFVLLQQLAKQGLAIVMTVHDLQWAAHVDRVALLSEGTLLDCGTPDQVLAPALLSQAFQTPIEVAWSSEQSLAFSSSPRAWIGAKLSPEGRS